MDEKKLEKLYDKASTKKLVEMFSKARALKKQGTRLTEESDTITSNVVSTVERRLDKMDDTKEHLGTEQFYEMSRQWSIMSASLTRVKSSIKLPSFHSGLNLYINPSYGIKEYKRFTRYSPFHQSNLRPSAEERRPFRYEEGILAIMKRSWDEGTLNFNMLQKIPQLDQDRIHQFIEITKDIVYMTDSWRNFHRTKAGPQLDAFKQMKQTSGSYMINDEKEYQTNLSNLDKLIAFKKQLSIDTTKQAARWELIVKKWKETNKNFLVLNELRKSKLKI